MVEIHNSEMEITLRGVCPEVGMRISNYVSAELANVTNSLKCK